jgi:hypothetical protein
MTMGARTGIETATVPKEDGRWTGKTACKAVEPEENEKEEIIKKGLSSARIRMGKFGKSSGS